MRKLLNFNNRIPAHNNRRAVSKVHGRKVLIMPSDLKMLGMENHGLLGLLNHHV